MESRSLHMDSHPTRYVMLEFDEYVCHEWCTECHSHVSFKEMNTPWQLRDGVEGSIENPLWPELHCLEELRSYVMDALRKAVYLQDCIETVPRNLPGAMKNYISKEDASPHSIFEYLTREHREIYPNLLPGYVLINRTCPICLEVVRTSSDISEYQTQYGGSWLSKEYMDVAEYIESSGLGTSSLDSSAFHAEIHFRHKLCAYAQLAGECEVDFDDEGFQEE